MGVNVTGDNAGQSESMTECGDMNACGSRQGKQEANLIRHG